MYILLVFPNTAPIHEHNSEIPTFPGLLRDRFFPGNLYVTNEKSGITASNSWIFTGSSGCHSIWSNSARQLVKFEEVEH